MELRHLRYFAAVAECCHFGLAAEQLHVAQPALSYAIRQLEAELDVTLFNRTTRQVPLTAAGEFLHGRGRPDPGRRRRRRARQSAESRPDAAALFGSASPGPRLSRICPGSRGWSSGNCPAWPWRSTPTCSPPTSATACAPAPSISVFCAHPPSARASNCAPSRSKSLVLAVPVDHRLAVEPVVSMADLRNEPFVAYASRDSAVNDAVLRSCRQAGFVPHREHAAPGTAVLLALVAAGLGSPSYRIPCAPCRWTAWSSGTCSTRAPSSWPWPGARDRTTRSSRPSSTSWKPCSGSMPCPPTAGGTL